MEWVEITAETVDAAREIALDRLGVDEQDAEIEVLAEPTRKFLRRTDARIRARVVPKPPREKRERRRGGGRGGRGGDKGGRGGGGRRSGGGARGGRRPQSTADAPSDSTTSDAEAPVASAATSPSSTDEQVGAGARGDGGGSDGAAGGNGRRRRRRGSGGGRSGSKDGQAEQEDAVTTLDEQVELAERFLDGLLESFGVDGTIDRVDVDDELVELQVDGDELGLLIGHRGSTIQAVNEVMRTGLQRQAGGSAEGRVRVDIGGYRERRREALGRFAADQAAAVKESGEERALEPMNAADRKVVHDAINEIDGVETLSEGAEPRRWVVIVPTD